MEGSEEEHRKYTEGRVPPDPRLSFHLCEQGADTLLSSPIPQIQPTYTVIKADMEMPFFFHPELSETTVFLSGDANKASPDTGNRQKRSLLARAANTEQTV